MSGVGRHNCCLAHYTHRSACTFASTAYSGSRHRHGRRTPILWQEAGPLCNTHMNKSTADFRQRTTFSRLTMRGKTLQRDKPSNQSLASHMSQTPSTPSDESHQVSHQSSYATFTSQMSRKSVSASARTLHMYSMSSTQPSRHESEDDEEDGDNTHQNGTSAGHTPARASSVGSIAQTLAAAPGKEASQSTWHVSPPPPVATSPLSRPPSPAPHGILKPSSREQVLCDHCHQKCKHSVQDALERTPTDTSSSSRSGDGWGPQKWKKPRKKTSNVTFASTVDEVHSADLTESHPASPVQQTAETVEPPGEAAPALPLRVERDVDTITLPEKFRAEDVGLPLKPAKSAPALHAPVELPPVVSPRTAPVVITLSPIVTPEMPDEPLTDSIALGKLRQLRDRSKMTAATVGRSFLTVFWKPKHSKPRKAI